MGFWDIIKSFFESPGPKFRKPNLIPPENGKSPEELATRLSMPIYRLSEIPLDYHQFQIPKHSTGMRTITAPNQQLKEIQRTILHRLLGRLQAHPAAIGFEKGLSIVSNAVYHVGADIVLRMDIRDFFHSTSSDRVRGYFYGIGWGKEATDILIRLCTHENHLPQGTPASPRLSNLVNYELDTRLDGFAQKIGARYTRYADDITFSFHTDTMRQTSLYAQNPKTLERVEHKMDESHIIHSTIHMTKFVLFEHGYKLHTKRKLNIRRKHQCQKVTGLVVNEKVALPRKTRRLLRAVEHRLKEGRQATMTPEQLAGWKALQQMIETQSKLPGDFQQPGSLIE